MTSKRLGLAVLVASCVALAGCGAGNWRESAGAVGGAVLGGVAGSQIGEGSGQAIATAAGAAIGMVFFGNLGRDLDEHARMKAEQAKVKALDTGRSIQWEASNDGGSGGPARGTIEIGLTRSNTATWRVCREYVHTVQIDGKETEVRGTACRDPAGDEWVEA